MFVAGSLSTDACGLSTGAHVLNHVKMSFNDNKVFWEEFINAFKAHPCLWKVKSKDFMNTELRNKAYRNLIEKCKEINPAADLAFVKKKIESLRNSYRRELRKVRQSRSTGSSTDEVYVPTLWYYNLLQFSSDQEEARIGTSSIASPPSSLGDESLIQEPSSPSTSSAASSIQSTTRNKKCNLNLSQKKAKFLEIASSELQRHTYKEQAFGDSVSSDLEQMEEIQCIIAKKLISDVLYHGRMGLLNLNSSISDNVQPQNAQSFSYSSYNINNTESQNSANQFLSTVPMQPQKLIPLFQQNLPYTNRNQFSQQQASGIIIGQREVSEQDSPINIIEDIEIKNVEELNKFIKFKNINKK